MASRFRRVLERIHLNVIGGGRGETDTDGELSRLVCGPAGDEYSIEAWLRVGWPFLSDLYEILLGWLHERVFGYGIRVKRTPITPSAPILHEERVKRRAEVKERMDILTDEIKTGRFDRT